MISEVLVGARNKILIAFECRQIKNFIGDNVTYDADITNDASMMSLECLQYHWGKGIVCFLLNFLVTNIGSDLWF
jgi:hypothetical protein